MNRYKEPPSATRNDQEPSSQEVIQSMHRLQPIGTDPARIEELERENARLQLLVAELLIKNHQLRTSE